jgi:hypothetical protein
MIGEKWVYSFIAGLLFIALSSPLMFKITQALAKPFGLSFYVNGAPTMQGITFHGIVFMLITRVLMG